MVDEGTHPRFFLPGDVARRSKVSVERNGVRRWVPLTCLVPGQCDTTPGMEMKSSGSPSGAVKALRPRSTTGRVRSLRKLVDEAMELERLTMQLYCMFENRFCEPEELRTFWLDMALHESRHFGALALIACLLDCASRRELAVDPKLTMSHIRRLHRLLVKACTEASRGISLDRAFEIALQVEGSEIEDVALELLCVLQGEAERGRAVKLLIHDLGDLSYMIEKYSADPRLLELADALLEQRVGRLRITVQPESVRRDRKK